MKFKVVPYGKWWRHLAKGNLSMAYRAIFGWKRSGAYSSPLLLDNFRLTITKSTKRKRAIVMHQAQARLIYHERLHLAGIDRSEMDMGKPVVLWRRFRGVEGKETWEMLPAMIADWTLATIPEREPNVERARIYRIAVIEVRSNGDIQ